MSLSLTSKLPDVGTTIFSVMSGLANKHGAINLSQGFPDFEPPQELRDRVAHHLNSGHNQYAPMHGIQDLRERISVQIERRYGVLRDPEHEVTITSGATEALFSTIAALVGAGDEVIVFDPAYDSYDPAIRLAGGRCMHVPLDEDTFNIDFDRLARALNEKTRLVIINSPHNPAGSVLKNTDLDELAALLGPRDCYLLSDEVYENIVFDDHRHVSVVGHPELDARSVAVFSFGKTYHATGWKVGYCVAAPEITTEIRRVHQFNTFTTATPLQWALADFMTAEPHYADGISAFYEEKRNLFAELLGDTAFSLQPCAGTYFQLADYSAVSDLPDVEFARWLTVEAGVAVIPVSVFCKEPMHRRLIRFCFAKEDATLERAAERLCKI